MAILGRLMHSIHDGHGFYTDWGTTDWPDGYLGIQIGWSMEKRSFAQVFTQT